MPKQKGIKDQDRLPPTILAEKVEILNPAEYKKDPTMLTIVLHEEDHTLGNALKHVICQMPGVEFCGYNTPHPLEDKILVRIQTEKGVKAGDVLCQGLADVWQIFDQIQSKFKQAHAEFQAEKTGGSSIVVEPTGEEMMIGHDEDEDAER